MVKLLYDFQYFTYDQLLDIFDKVIGRYSKCRPENISKVILDTREIDLDEYKNLKVISRVGVGVDNIDLEECKKRKIKVFNTVCKELSDAVADFTVKQILNLLAFSNPREALQGKTVLIVGYGRIGQEVDKRLKAFGAKTLSIDVKDYEFKDDYCYDLRMFIAESNIVTVHTSGNEEVIGIDMIDVMPNGSYLLNMARANSINIVYAYSSYIVEQLKGIATDVNEDVPYWYSGTGTVNILSTNHIASNTIEARKKMEELAVYNLKSEPDGRRVV